MRKAVKSGDQWRIQAILGMCAARNITLPEYDFGDGWDMGDDESEPYPAILKNEDGTVTVHMNAPVKINGVVKPLKEWCKQSGISRCGIRYRILKGWDIEKAVTQRVRPMV
jgi:hypothetical protein